jgi:hypothetical protein
MFALFGFSQKVVLLKAVHSLNICQHTKFSGLTLVQILHPHQKVEHLLFLNG